MVRFMDKTLQEGYEIGRREGAKEVLLELKKQIHDNAVYTYSQDIPNYIQLKVFDAILQNTIKEYTENNP